MKREIVVNRPGPLALVVDRGRFGFLAMGVSWGGAADLLAYTAAHRLAGNTANEAAIEITFGGSHFTFTERTLFALAGAECMATLNGRTVSSWRSYEAEAGETLALRPPQRGVRTILAVHGGIDVPLVMGSRSTDLAARMGGFQGRALKAGDRLSIIDTSAEPIIDTPAIEPVILSARRRRAVEGPGANAPIAIRVIPGGEFNMLSRNAQQRFWNAEWTVTAESSRIATMFDGEPLQTSGLPELRSHAVVPGVIQLPPSGLPIVLQCDAHTTGGYPKLGVVIEAELWSVAQMPPGTRVRFTAITIEEAAEATKEIEADVKANRFER
jgi:5-oxoprolinase (ATP-hydrolysing) subunit C